MCLKKPTLTVHGILITLRALVKHNKYILITVYVSMLNSCL